MPSQENGDRGHRQLDHTADLALELWGPDEESILIAGLEAVIDILTGGAPPAPRAQRDLRLEALDPGDRLVRWLNEIVYLATVSGFVACAADIELESTGLRARIGGEEDAGDRLVTEIKSVTYHDLRIDRLPERIVARVVLDV